MSWGFFLDLDITLPTDAYEQLLSTTGGSLPANWWGFSDPDLEQTFTGTEFDEMSFERTFGIFEDGDGCAKKVETSDGSTRVRFCMMLDKSGETQSAKVYAAFADAAAKQGATGHILLINDGTYSGEAGVKITLGDGGVQRAAIDEAEHMEMMEEIAARAFGRGGESEGPDPAHEIEPDPVRPTEETANAPVAKPAKTGSKAVKATKQAKPAAKKKPAARKKPAAKKKPLAKKKPAAKKKPTPKKAAAKKSSKKPASKKKR